MTTMAIREEVHEFVESELTDAALRPAWELTSRVSPIVAATPLPQAAALFRRAVEQAVLEELPAYWNRRAHALDRARPHPGDRPGPDDRARERRLAADAARCRMHAHLMAGDVLLAPEFAQDVALVLNGGEER